MLRYLADENLRRIIVRGLRRHCPSLPVYIAQEIGLSGQEDPVVLEYAATNDLVVLTHDINTMVAFAYDRINRGLAMPGLIEVRLNSPLVIVIEDLTLIALATSASEIAGRVIFVPL